MGSNRGAESRRLLIKYNSLPHRLGGSEGGDGDAGIMTFMTGIMTCLNAYRLLALTRAAG